MKMKINKYHIGKKMKIYSDQNFSKIYYKHLIINSNANHAIRFYQQKYLITIIGFTII